MARSSGCSLLVALVLGAALAAPAATADPAPPPTPAPAAPPAPAPAAPAKPDESAAPRPLPPEPVGGACTRARAEADLRAKSAGRRPTRGQIDAEFERCFRDRIAACQLALDAEADEGFACWKQDPWPEVPASVAPEDIAKTGMCLLELKGVIADLRKCRAKKPAERDACVTPYIGYVPECPLLKADRVWRAFPGREDVERAAQADLERGKPKAQPQPLQKPQPAQRPQPPQPSQPQKPTPAPQPPPPQKQPTQQPTPATTPTQPPKK
jgi:hypothetical protein